MQGVRPAQYDSVTRVLGANLAGLDPTTLSALDADLALGRVMMDTRSDFILSPHYSAVYAKASQELWDGVH